MTDDVVHGLDASDDEVGSSTLETMALARRYNAWQVARIAPYLGHRICEVGAGIGNISALLVERAPDLLMLTDQDPYYLRRLRERFAGMPSVLVAPLTLPDDGVRERFLRHRIDTVIALNVLEHIPDDRGALQSMRDMLVSGGRIVVLVPAMRVLYGSLDRELGHVRRYDVGALRRLFGDADLLIDKMFFFNMVGAFGWFANARLLGVARIPERQVRWFDRLVPCLRIEDFLPRPFGQSLIAVGVRA